MNENLQNCMRVGHGHVFCTDTVGNDLVQCLIAKTLQKIK